ncbi:MAG: hypothetical protein KDA92_12275, partial [Planctomycetales bacterium]|nr:hypothetical protein [Planctomycetales bacterium]
TDVTHVIESADTSEQELESAFAEFMSRYNAKSPTTAASPPTVTPTTPSPSAGPKVKETAEPATPSPTSTTVSTKRTQSSSPSTSPSEAVAKTIKAPVDPRTMTKQRESMDAIREMRSVANDITRSVLINHHTVLTQRRVLTYLAFATCSVCACIGTSLWATTLRSSSYWLSLSFYAVSILLVTRVAAEKKQYAAKCRDW